MAVGVANLVNTETPDADFPFGDLRDNPGDGSGTPVNRLMLSDPLQFFEKLMSEAGVTPSGIPDSEYSGWQLYDALRAIFPLREKIITTTWNMDTTASIAVAHGVANFLNIRRVDAVVLNNTNVAMVNIRGIADASIGFIDATEISLSRDNGGFFDSASYNAATVHVIISYID